MHCVVLTGLACSIHATWGSLVICEQPSLDIFANDYVTDWDCGANTCLFCCALQDGCSNLGKLGGHRPGDGRGAVAAVALA